VDKGDLEEFFKKCEIFEKKALLFGHKTALILYNNR
jgi:hypothetical protein